MAEYTLNGRLIIERGNKRVRHSNRAWGYYNVVMFCDITEDGSPIHAPASAPSCLPAGKFNESARPTGRCRISSGGKFVLALTHAEAARMHAAERLREAQAQARREEEDDFVVKAAGENGR